MKNFFQKWQLEILFTLCTIVIVVLAFLYGILYLLLTDTPSSWVYERRPLVMILPHQDDEMFMAGKFLSLSQQGYIPYGVLVTDGGNSHIRLDLIHQGYKNLDTQHFSEARNREFFASMKILGVAPEHIFFMNEGEILSTPHPEYHDGSLTLDQATKIIETLYQKIGDGIYMTVSGGHPDHVALERALKKFPKISDKLFFPLEKTEDSQVFFLTSFERENKQRALLEYSVWNPEENRFAIGKHSVDSLMQKWASSTTEYYFDTLTNP